MARTYDLLSNQIQYHIQQLTYLKAKIFRSQIQYEYIMLSTSLKGSKVGCKVLGVELPSGHRLESPQGHKRPEILLIR